MDIVLTANIAPSYMPTFPTQRFNELPKPKPPLARRLTVTDVSEHECIFDATHPIGTAFISNDNNPPTD